MRNFLLLFFSSFYFSTTGITQDVWTLDSTEVHVETAVDASLVDGAWDIHWGPDNKLWFTDLEYIKRYDPATLLVDTVLFRPGDNGLGIVTHPDLLNGTPYVFIAFDTAAYYASNDWVDVYRYEFSGGQLINPLLIFSYSHVGEHAGGRMVITADNKLMLTTADYWFGGDPLRGRTLRLNLDGSIPADNPDPTTYEYSSGHRNPQGLVQIPNGNVYNSEHGQFGVDEINLIRPGRHYGWPAYDGDACSDFVPDSCSSATYSYESPLLLLTMSPPSGLDFYNHTAIPEFSNSLLVGTLASRAIDVHTLNTAGDAVTGSLRVFSQGYGRIRDVAVAPDGSVYFIGFDRDPESKNAIYRIVNPLSVGVSTIENEWAGSRLFPNPAHDQYNLVLHPFSDGVTIALTHVTGEVISCSAVENGVKQLKFSTTELSHGIYFVQIMVRGRIVETLKLLVE